MDGWFRYDDASGTLRRHRWRSGGFRSCELNAAGWAAALGPGVVIGAGVGWLTPLPTGVTVVGGVAASWAAALVIDRVAWCRIPFGVSNDRLTWTQAAAVVAELRTDGHDVTLTAHRQQPGRSPGSAGEPAWTIRSINRHHRAVMAAIERAAARPHGADGSGNG